MPTSTPQHLLKNQASDIAVGANPLFGRLENETFTVDIWSPSGAWGGATVNIYMESAEAGDHTPILLESFTEDTVRQGFNGQIGRRLKADVVGAIAADISATLNC